MRINLHLCRFSLSPFDVCLLKCRQLCCSFSECVNKTDSGVFRVQVEMIFSLSSVMRLEEIFDLEWLDNHPWLSPDFHLYSTLPWKLHKQPSSLELIRVITTLPTKRHTSPDVGMASVLHLCSRSMLHSIFFISLLMHLAETIILMNTTSKIYIFYYMTFFISMF